MSSGDRRHPRFIIGLIALEYQTVVGQFYTCRQFGVGFVVVEVMGHMSEVGLGGLEFGDDCQGLFNIEVSRVFFMTQRVEDQKLDAAKSL